MSLNNFKKTYPLLFSNTITDNHLKGLLETLELGLTLKYSEAIEEELYLFNDSLPIDQENITIETIVKLLKEEIFRSIDYWKASSYKNPNKVNFIDERSLLIDYINKNAGSDIIEDYRKSFDLILDVLNTFSKKVTLGERENSSFIYNFEIIRNYVKENKIKVDGSIFITSNFGSMAHSMHSTIIPSIPLSAPSSTLQYVNTVSSTNPLASTNILAQASSAANSGKHSKSSKGKKKP